MPQGTAKKKKVGAGERPEREISLSFCLSRSYADTVRRWLSANQEVQFS